MDIAEVWKFIPTAPIWCNAKKLRDILQNHYSYII